MAMDDLIRRADGWLQRNRPDYYAILRPGVDDAALDAYAARFGLVLPAEFRALYRWRDGQDPAQWKKVGSSWRNERRPYFCEADISLLHGQSAVDVKRLRFGETN